MKEKSSDKFWELTRIPLCIHFSSLTSYAVSIRRTIKTVSRFGWGKSFRQTKPDVLSLWTDLASCRWHSFRALFFKLSANFFNSSLDQTKPMTHWIEKGPPHFALDVEVFEELAPIVVLLSTAWLVPLGLRLPCAGVLFLSWITLAIGWT